MFNCPIENCPKAYTQKHNLSRHIKVYHGIRNGVPEANQLEDNQSMEVNKFFGSNGRGNVNGYADVDVEGSKTSSEYSDAVSEQPDFEEEDMDSEVEDEEEQEQEEQDVEEVDIEIDTAEFLENYLIDKYISGDELTKKNVRDAVVIKQSFKGFSSNLNGIDEGNVLVTRSSIRLLIYLFRSCRKGLITLTTQLFNDYLFSINNSWVEDTIVIQTDTAQYLENKIYEALADGEKLTPDKIHIWARREQGDADFSDVELDR